MLDESNRRLMGLSIAQRKAIEAKRQAEARKQERDEERLFAQYVRRKDAERDLKAQEETDAIAAWLRKREAV